MAWVRELGPWGCRARLAPARWWAMPHAVFVLAGPIAHAACPRHASRLICFFRRDLQGRRRFRGRALQHEECHLTPLREITAKLPA